MTRLLVVMGSGETTPTMIKPHRSLFAAMPTGGRAVLLDTPYGFQLNADEISARAVGYFAQSVGQAVEVVSWRRAPGPGLDRERALTALRGASWIFAGPGSPSYALRQWRDTDLPTVLPRADVLVFASAAALTLGSHTIPVYEIYKAGADPHWLPGLNLFEQLTGVPAVVIPHYDNAEGGHHDTRYCYLGEPRLRLLERELPDDHLIVGVDEHTALICDLDQRTATVTGNGRLTLRRHGQSTTYPPNTTLPLPFPDERKGPFLSVSVVEGPLLDAAVHATAGGPDGHRGDGAGTSADSVTVGDSHVLPADGRWGAGDRTAMAGEDAKTAGQSLARGNGDGRGHGDALGGSGGDGVVGGGTRVATSLREAADEVEQRFTTALNARDIDGCVAAALDLEQVITDWTADTNVSNDGDHARGLLRGMVVRLGELAGTADPTPLLTPLVEALLVVRQSARERRDWPAADQVRDALAAARIEVRDTPDGPVWLPPS
ncbi:CysS/YqeB C-terminal domain-containing protein [Catellatospora tritici]|uniref:CysS/YqeB C-terminal domain-containing protein n=1 Tax=Catellatospora tritici TaxID=2851566 RepID=UPI001C2DCD7F|nr:hypothetical protein [Catellatospora tritici]MBV1849674.1 hypothetical protein [Catellatospora tritici]